MIKFFSASLILLFSSSITSFSQTNSVGEFNKFIAQNWAGDYVRIGQYKVKGTPYLLGESFPGTITYRGGTKADAKILYDLYTQKAGEDVRNTIAEATQPVEQFTILLPEKFGEEKLLFQSSDMFGNESLKVYFNVLEDGSKASLLKVFKIKLVSDPVNMMDKEQKLFEQYYEYYLYNKTTKELAKIKLKAKDFSKQLGDDNFVKTFIDNGDLDVSNEKHAIKLIKGYNTK